MDNIDTDYRNLTKAQVIQKYIVNINILKHFAQINNITNNEFNNYIINYLKEQQNSYSNKKIFIQNLIYRKKQIILYMLTIIIFALLFFYKQETASILLRNIQNFIYPGMKLWRKLSLPVIAKFPSLTELYDESCLVSNPFFHIEGLNCAPCAETINVLDLTNFQNTNTDSPYIFKTSDSLFDLATFNELYKLYEPVFREHAFKIQSTHKDIKNLEDLFSNFLNRSNQQESHNLWKCNRMAPARLLRKLFPSIKRIPTTGISPERYLSIDTAKAQPYPIPDTECSNAFIVQLDGTRTIVLRPTNECRHICRTVSIRLPRSYVLMYNWWYWKPISVPEHYSLIPSISYIGSYC